MSVALLAALFIASAAQATTRTETKDYKVGSDGQPLCFDPTLNGIDGSVDEIWDEAKYDQRVGGACFYLLGDELEADIEIKDLTELPIGGAYIFSTEAGNGIGGSLTPFCGSISDVVVPTGAAQLNVYVAGPIAGPAFCLLLGQVGIGGTVGEIAVTYDIGTQTGYPPIDEERECFEPTPDSASVKGTTDEDQLVDLAVLVLLDGVDEEFAEAAFQRAADAYAPLGITMTVEDFEEVSFVGTDAQGLINQAKTHVEGQRPTDTAIVYTLTNKDIQAAGSANVAGLADCIGGVRFPERAFAVGEVLGEIDILGFNFYVDGTAKVAAHEIGHLMGGQHHYGNCVEGENNTANSEVTPCTLMFNAADFLSLKFGTLNAAVVRGHALAYA